MRTVAFSSCVSHIMRSQTRPSDETAGLLATHPTAAGYTRVVATYWGQPER